MVVVTGDDAAIAGYVRNGGRLVLLPEAETSLNPFFPHWQNVKGRRALRGRCGGGTGRQGLLAAPRPFGHIPGGPMLDATFDRVMPAHVINGATSWISRGGFMPGW